MPRGQISLAKLAQSLDYGAAVLELDGNFDDAMRVIRELAEDESIYLVNSINPFRIEGQKTVAAELLHQRGWRVPDHVVVPGGNLGNSTAFGKGFAELLDLGLIDRLPRPECVQAEGPALSQPVLSLLPIAKRKPLPRPRRLAGSAWPQLNLRLERLALANSNRSSPTLATAIKLGARFHGRRPCVRCWRAAVEC